MGWLVQHTGSEEDGDDGDDEDDGDGDEDDVNDGDEDGDANVGRCVGSYDTPDLKKK